MLLLEMYITIFITGNILIKRGTKLNYQINYIHRLKWTSGANHTAAHSTADAASPAQPVPYKR